MNYNYIDFPKKYDLVSYTDSINTYIERVREISGVLAIYQIGKINTMGISDIDLVVVVDDHFNSFDFPKLSIKKVFADDPVASYLFTHDVFVLNKESFININYLAYFTEIKHLFGESILPKKLEDLEEKIIHFSVLLDFVLFRLHQFRTETKTCNFSVRNNLVRISSLKHSIALGKSIGINYDFSQIENKINQIRDSWFEKEDQETVKDLLAESVKYFFVLIEKANKIFQRDYLCFADEKYEKLLLMLADGQNITVFSDRNIAEEEEISLELERVFNKVSSDQNNVLVYPRELYFHYLTYNEVADDYFKQKLRGKLINTDLSFGVQKIYKDTLQKRCSFLSKYYCFINENRITFTSLAGNPGFNMIGWK